MDTYTEDSNDSLPRASGKVVPPVTAKLIRERYDRGARALRSESISYWLAQSFMSGEQWLYHNRTTNDLKQLPREEGRVRVTVNRIWPSSRTVMAKLLSRQLRFEVPPGGTDDASTRGAYLAESILEHLHRDHDWERLREENAWAAWMGGTALLAVDWDPQAGTTIGTSPMSGEPIGTGDIVETSLTITECAFEPGIRDGERATWWVRAQALPAAEVQARYRLAEAPKTDAQAGYTNTNQRFTSNERVNASSDLTLVLTMYERPNHMRPQGSVATVVGEKIVDGPHPWPFPFKDRLNVVIARETRVPGRWTGDTIVQAAIPVQVALNASWSTIIEHMKLAGNARMLIPEASIDMMDELTDMPGEGIPYNPSAGEPKYLAAPQMPQWWVEQPNRLANELDDTLGVHDVSRGDAPRNIESGAGLAILAEADSTPIGRMTKEMAEAWGRYASLVLEIYAAKVKESRKARITVGQIPEVVTWSGESLKGQTHARVPLEAVMPRNRAAMMQQAQSMWENKIITDPVQFFRIADMARQDEIIASIDEDAEKARRENHLMSMGEICLPADFDHHAKHIKTHNSLRKSARYESMDPAQREVIDLHIQAHETKAGEEAGKQVAKMRVAGELAGAPTADEAVLPVPPGMEQPAPSPLAAGPQGLEQIVASEKQALL